MVLNHVFKLYACSAVGAMLSWNRVLVDICQNVWECFHPPWDSYVWIHWLNISWGSYVKGTRKHFCNWFSVLSLYIVQVDVTVTLHFTCLAHITRLAWWYPWLSPLEPTHNHGHFWVQLRTELMFPEDLLADTVLHRSLVSWRERGSPLLCLCILDHGQFCHKYWFILSCNSRRMQFMKGLLNCCLILREWYQQ
jgi:hypothetical protein